MVHAAPRTLSTSVRQVYAMQAGEIVTAFKSASTHQLDNSKFWDALFYRSSIISDQFTTCHISSILSSLVNYPKFHSKIFVQFLLNRFFPTISSSSSFNAISVSDLTMIMHGIEKLSIYSSMECCNFWTEKISPIIASPGKLKPSILPNNVYQVARFACKYNDEVVKKQIVEMILRDDDEKLFSTPVLATKYFNLFVPLTDAHGIKRDDSDEDEEEYEPFFHHSSESCWDNVDISFITKILNKCIALSSKWNTKDIISFASAMSRIPNSQLALLGHPSPLAIQNLLCRRISQNLISFKIDQLVLLSQIYAEMNIGANFFDPLMNELIYRVREIKPKNCVKILPRMKSREHFETVCTRLLKYDSNSELKTDEILQIAKIIAQHEQEEISGPPSRVARQVVFNLIPNVKQVDLEIFLPIIANLNIKFDLNKLMKIFRINRLNFMEKLNGNNIGELALSLARLDIFDDELFNKRIWEFENVADPYKLVESIALFHERIHSIDNEKISNLLSNSSPNSIVKLFLRKIGLNNISDSSDMFRDDIPAQLTCLDQVILCPVSSNLILVHVESFANWMVRNRPNGTTLIRCLDDIDVTDFVALEIFSEKFLHINLLGNEEMPKLNKFGETHHKLVQDQFIHISPFIPSIHTDEMIEHIVNELARN